MNGFPLPGLICCFLTTAELIPSNSGWHLNLGLYMSDLNDTAYWLERASQARQTAESFAYEGARKQMMAIAEGYDQLAKMAEQLKLVTGATASSSQAPGCNQRNALLANCRL
ncbi:MAG TPA: hypothetical protein VN656_08790 [Stellaceae bacterium]|nr:hypothetical protein [Stellaceae bacterium]